MAASSSSSSSSSSASSAAAACARASAAAAAMVVVLACVLAGEGAQAGEHQVGGAPGWSTMSNVNYTAWADGQTFAVGDTLYFNYSNLYHNVVELATQSAYASCDVSDPEHTWRDGGTKVNLTSEGTFYFTCSFPNHCKLGQKVAVTVPTSSSSANSTASNSTAPGSASARPPSPPPLLLLLLPLSLIILISALL